MIAGNSKTLSLFSEADVARYCNTCLDIALAGDDHYGFAISEESTCVAETRLRKDKRRLCRLRRRP